MSIGAASDPDDATTRDGLVSAADAALYQAKASGGNQVATPEVKAGTATAVTATAVTAPGG